MMAAAPMAGVRLNGQGPDPALIQFGVTRILVPNTWKFWHSSLFVVWALINRDLHAHGTLLVLLLSIDHETSGQLKTVSKILTDSKFLRLRK